jgi:glucosamine-phosphate N-acetyltransferase
MADALTNGTIPNGTISSSTPEEGLFTSDLVSPIIAAQLPSTYTIRALRKSDYARGFLDCLKVLTVVGDISEQKWDERYNWMNTLGKGGYYILVIDDGSRIVGTGALIVERKLYVFLLSSDSTQTSVGYVTVQ